MLCFYFLGRLLQKVKKFKLFARLVDKLFVSIVQSKSQLEPKTE